MVVPNTTNGDLHIPMVPRSKDEMTTVQLVNCRLIRSGTIIRDDLWIRNGKIINPEPVFYDEKKKADVVIDCQNCLIAPGFIDLQINGGFGYDFSSDIEKLDKAISTVRKGILESGVTSFCPTVVTSPSTIYHEVLERTKKCEGDAKGAGILGIHCEGPFIDKEKKGAHPLDHIQTYEIGMEVVNKVYGKLDNVSIITLAPELPGSCDVVSALTKQGIVISLGHSRSNLEQGEAAINNGASFITHLFNAMLPFHHRDPGLVGLLTSKLVNKKVFYGIISDGIHTHPAALRIAHRTHPEGLVLVTDAMAAMGLGEGDHNLGQLDVVVKDRRAYIKGTETLAGSIATMDDCIRRFKKATDVSLVEAIEAATLHPAQVLGITDKKGTLDFNSDADFVFIDDRESLKVLRTFIAGQCVYDSYKGFNVVNGHNGNA